MERFSRDSAHLKHSNTCPRFSNSKTLAFPTEELESNAKCSSFWGWGGGGGGRGEYFIDVRNMRRIHGRITGNQLPVHVPSFLREPVKISRMAGKERTK